MSMVGIENVTSYKHCVHFTTEHAQTVSLIPRLFVTATNNLGRPEDESTYNDVVTVKGYSNACTDSVNTENGTSEKQGELICKWQV